MTSEHNIWTVCHGTDAVLDILFIHGLTGTPEETWTAGTADKEYWPKWLCDSFSNVSIYTLGYPASVFEQWATQEMNLYERANDMLKQLASYNIGYRPLVIVTHSLGGILAKVMLRASNESSNVAWKRIVTSTRLVVFLSTPHTGAALAEVVRHFLPRSVSTHVRILSNSDGSLRDLNQSYRNLVDQREHIATLSFYEKFKTYKSVLVVPPESADPGLGGRALPPLAVDADHISICKPLVARI
jgi:pimeloyl-ACP methyl ester carboxylesterase